jgi:hypothetical protein
MFLAIIANARTATGLSSHIFGQDLVNDEARSSLLNFVYSGESYLPQPFPTELRDVSAMVPSPSGRQGHPRLPAFQIMRAFST